MGNKVFLTVYGDIWLKKIWHLKAGVPTVHKRLTDARRYAKGKGFLGIRVKFARWLPSPGERGRP